MRGGAMMRTDSSSYQGFYCGGMYYLRCTDEKEEWGVVLGEREREEIGYEIRKEEIEEWLWIVYI